MEMCCASDLQLQMHFFSPLDSLRPEPPPCLAPSSLHQLYKNVVPRPTRIIIQTPNADTLRPSPLLPSSPPSAKEADPLALLPPVEQKSSKKLSSPSLAATRIPVANPTRLSKPKQMKVFLLEDLKDFGKKGAFLSPSLLVGRSSGGGGALSKG